MATSGLLAANVLLEGSGKVSAQPPAQQGGQKEGGRDPTRPAHLSPAALQLSGHLPSSEVGGPLGLPVGRPEQPSPGGH